MLQNKLKSLLLVSLSMGFGVIAYGAETVTSPLPEKDWSCPLSDTLSIDMVYIAPNTFSMGSPTNELGHFGDETIHTVKLSSGYWLGKHEVTQAQWSAIMENSPSGFKGDTLPVENVSWYDADSFCKKLTEREREAGRLGKDWCYALPTEAQWEYACRAGTQSALNNGKELSDERICPELDAIAWYWDNSGRDLQQHFGTHSVGMKTPNAWGLYDMHGNVAEWVRDGYRGYSQKEVTDPTGGGPGNTVCRGGSWADYAWCCRSADRCYYGSYCGANHVGFRLALVPDLSEK